MTKLSFTTIFFIASLFAAIVLTYRSENVMTTESDLEKYPELMPFLAGRIGFYPGAFNLDTNSFSFSFPVSFTYAADYFHEVDSRAIKEKWILLNNEKYSKIYARKSNNMMFMDRIILSYDIKRNVVFLIRNETYETSASRSE